jgi:hypothetical protein
MLSGGSVAFARVPDREIAMRPCPRCKTMVPEPAAVAIIFNEGRSYYCGSYGTGGCGALLLRDAPGEPWRLDETVQQPAWPDEQ